MVSERIKSLRMKVVGAKERSRERKQKRREQLEELAQPVTSRVEAAREEVAATKEETRLLGEELGLDRISVPDFEAPDLGEAPDVDPIAEPPPAPGPMGGSDRPATADDTLRMGPTGSDRFSIENDDT